MNRERLEQLRGQYRSALLEDVVPFWMRHGVDRECGGFYTCVARDGALYSTDKPVWFVGRATWLWAALYNRVEARAEWLDLARHGYAFMLRHCFDERGKMYFLVDRQGRPLRMRRYVYSEVFAALALAELARATGDESMRGQAWDVFENMLRYLRTPGLIEPKGIPGARPMKGLSPLMCTLNVAQTLREMETSRKWGHPATRGALHSIASTPRTLAHLDREIGDATAEILAHFVKHEDGCVLENVGPSGERLDTIEGRTMNPGHAIECGWFMLDALRQVHGGDAGMQRTAGESVRGALRVIDYAMQRGWDAEHGGLLYFVDVDGQPATQLEHDMKLWWPHNEALIALLLAWQVSGDAKYAAEFERVHDWTWRHFPDPQYGEWYGYLHRDGSVSTPLKGGIWKGPFHVPRALLYCWKLLEARLATAQEE